MKKITERISIILPNEIKKDLNTLKKIMQVDQSTLVRQLLAQAIQQKKIEIAIETYKKDKISFGKASEIAGLSLWEWIDECHKRNISLNFSMEEVEKEIQQINNGEFDKFIKKKKK